MSRHAGYRQWNDEDFDCMRSSPDLIVAIDCVSYLEWRNSDGGLDQIFAETHPHWRHFLRLCKIGYIAFGAADKAIGIDELSELFLSWEPSFKVAWQADFESLDPSNPDTVNLKKWRSEKYENFPHRDLQSKFYYSDEVERLRSQWLDMHEEHLRSIMALADLDRFEIQIAKIKKMQINLEDVSYLEVKQKLSLLAENLK
jgi:hypothetical protein